MDYKRVLDHVTAKSSCKNEEPLDGPDLIKATNELVGSKDCECLSEEFKQELS